MKATSAAYEADTISYDARKLTMKYSSTMPSTTRKKEITTRTVDSIMRS